MSDCSVPTFEERLARHLREISSRTEGSLLGATTGEIRAAAIGSEPELRAASFSRDADTEIAADSDFGAPAAAMDAEWRPDRRPVADPVEDAVDGIETLRSGETPRKESLLYAAAIILRQDRPTYRVLDDWLDASPAPPFTDLATHEPWLRPRLRAVGRIETERPLYGGVAGTGFLVARDLLLTNRHVASIFVEGLGERGSVATPGLVFRPDLDPRGDLRAESGQTEPLPIGFVEPLLMHPYWDIAILRVDGEALAEIEPLELEVQRPEEITGDAVAVIGYPVEAYLAEPELRELRRLYFENQFGIKRLMPGRVLDLHETTTLDPLGADGARRTVPALSHDASTLAGNSGSAVFALESRRLLGVHFRGEELVANFAVPAWELARDPRLHEIGVRFAQGPIEDPDPEVEAAWSAIPRE